MKICEKKKILSAEVAKALMTALDYSNPGLELAFAELFVLMQNKTIEKFKTLLSAVPPVEAE